MKHKLAMYYEKLDNERVHCLLCPQNCFIKQDGTGACRARKNIEGDLYSLNYGRITSISLDPIEKKPLNRFHPGSMILSAGTFGCNLKCAFCQNWTIAHTDPETADLLPPKLIAEALKLKPHGNIGIAYTYNEPTIWFEYVLESAKLAKENDLLNVLVTNGFIRQEPLLELIPYIDAMNIDVKAFTEDFYSKICGGKLEHVIRTVEAAANKCHVEVTTLVIPGLNDSIEDIGALSKWLASISPEIALHLSRFFPNYKMQDKPPTPGETLLRAKEKALENLKHVYIGNM